MMRDGGRYGKSHSERCGDRYGRRRLLLLGLVVFGVSSVVASLVTSANGLMRCGP